MKLGEVRRAVVVGLGITGAAVAEALLELNIEVLVVDSDDSETLRNRAAPLSRLGADVRLLEEDPTVLAEADLVVPSKGVPPVNPLVAGALGRGIPVWSEFELAWQMGARRIVAITGTNGKTTTSTLAARILDSGGLKPIAAGNLPTPLVEGARTAPAGSLFVCEASSFGLVFIEEFRPEVGVVLNVADDHYDWHSGYDEYLAAKARITENQSEEDLLAICSADAGAMEIARRSSALLAGFATAALDSVKLTIATDVGREPAIVAGVEDGYLVLHSERGDEPVLPVSDIRLQGRHNIENVLAASIVALRFGMQPGSIGEAVKGFEGLPHRMSFVAEVNGVTYIDDSKSTNPHSTLSAVEGLNHVVLIAGGRAKGLDLAPLGALNDRLSGVVVMGESAPELERIFHGLPLERASDVEDAVQRAAAIAREGETVLLSPACSSVDQYENYAERGERFVKAVLSR